MAPVDVVVVVAPVRAAVVAPHLHSRHPQCRASANPGCKWHPLHHLDKDHRMTHHPICSNNIDSRCLVALGLVAWVRALVLELAMAWALVLVLGESALGLEHQGNRYLHYMSWLGLCCILHRVPRKNRKSSRRPIYCSSNFLLPPHSEGQTRRHSQASRFS